MLLTGTLEFKSDQSSSGSAYGYYQTLDMARKHTCEECGEQFTQFIYQ